MLIKKERASSVPVSLIRLYVGGKPILKTMTYLISWLQQKWYLGVPLDCLLIHLKVAVLAPWTL